jgi:hypothetical protein
MLPSLLLCREGLVAMARKTTNDNSADHQLSLDDWAEAITADAKAADATAAPSEAVAVLAEALAARVAQQLSSRSLVSTNGQTSTSRLLTLDQLVAELPPAKRPQTWKRWLYERTRRGEVPGCVKLGGMLFFEREPALAWLRAGATAAK